MKQDRKHSGFTLVELLVAMSLAIVLASLAVGVVVSTGAQTSQKVVSAADKASGWLMVAKQRAIRDGNPQGVRFYLTVDPTDSTQSIYNCSEAQYIEKPPLPFVPNPGSDPNGARIVFEYRDTDGNNLIDNLDVRNVYYHPGNSAGGMTIFSNGTVQVNDQLMLSEFGTSFRITAIDPSDTNVTFGTGSVAMRKLTLADYPKLGASHATAANESNHVTYGVAFQSQPRPVFGELPLQFGDTSVIDFRYRINPSVPPTPGDTTIGITPKDLPVPLEYFDILFTSSGQVYSPGTTSIIALWVRDSSLSTNPYDFANAGEQVLVVVYPRTGSVSTCLVNPDAADPHKNAREGINAGL